MKLRTHSTCWRAALAAGALAMASSAGMAADGGMRVGRDANTGGLRAATADETQALESQTRAKADPHAHRRGLLSGRVDPKAEHRADGSKRLELTESHMSHVVVMRRPDGTLVQQHAPDAAAAERMVKGGQKTTFAKTMEERSREVK